MSHDNAVEWANGPGESHYGGDNTHAQSAWTSTRTYLDDINPKTGKANRERIPELFRMLAVRDKENWDDPRHTSPFEKSALHFLIRSDKASHIHIIKHRIGVSVNGESARYKELKEDRWFYPDDWPTEEEAEKSALAWNIRNTYITAMTTSHAAYHQLVELVTKWFELPINGTATPARKRAKESARFVLPHASQIDQDVMFNFLSFAHFQTLRNHPHSQREVRLIAQEMLRLVSDLPGNPFKHSIHAFGLDTPQKMPWTLE